MIYKIYINNSFRQSSAFFTWNKYSEFFIAIIFIIIMKIISRIFINRFFCIITYITFKLIIYNKWSSYLFFECSISLYSTYLFRCGLINLKILKSLSFNFGLIERYQPKQMMAKDRFKIIWPKHIVFIWIQEILIIIIYTWKSILN